MYYVAADTIRRMEKVHLPLLGPFRQASFAEAAKHMAARLCPDRNFVILYRDECPYGDSWPRLYRRVQSFWPDTYLIIVDPNRGELFAARSCYKTWRRATNSDELRDTLGVAVKKLGGVLTARGMYFCPEEVLKLLEYKPLPGLKQYMLRRQER